MTTTATPATADRADPAQTTTLDVRGPYELAEVALMGFGHRDERSFDGVMRMAFCLDGDLERQVGVAARQDGQRIELEVQVQPGSPPLSDDELERLRRQVARVISVDHDGEAFHQLCLADPVLAAVHQRAPGFRPALFYSPYEAAVWSIVSARRARSQGIGLRTKLAAEFGATFTVAGVETLGVPTPSQLLAVEAVPGLPADRIPRLHAVAEAARAGRLDADRLRELPPDEALTALQELPGIGPFYATLIVVRACGHADVLTVVENHARQAAGEAYGWDHDPTGPEFEELAERWRPFRTWVMVMFRALAGRAPAD